MTPVCVGRVKSQQAEHRNSSSELFRLYFYFPYHSQLNSAILRSILTSRAFICVSSCSNKTMSETSAGPHDRTRSTDSSEVSANSTTAPDSSGLASLSINTADGNETASQNSRPTCVKCNKAASLWCAGSCSYSEERGAAELTRYCSKDCQQEDWPEHKNSCLEVGRVNQVYRVSRAVQALYYAFRENTFERNIDRIAIEQHRIRIWEKTREKVIVPFPSDLILDARDREAVLSCLSCDSAVVWMQRIFSKLLEGSSHHCDLL